MKLLKLDRRCPLIAATKGPTRNGALRSFASTPRSSRLRRDIIVSKALQGKAPRRVPNTNDPEATSPVETTESFADLLSQFERSHSRRVEGGQQIRGTVVTVSADSVFVDIGFKSEGVLPLALFRDAGEEIAPGEKLSVSVKGRNLEGTMSSPASELNSPRTGRVWRRPSRRRR